MRARGDARAPTATATKARVATVVALACAAVACAARAATTRDAPRDATTGTTTTTRDDDVDVGAFAVDVDGCATHAWRGTWTRGASACATRAWTLARTGCGDEDDAETRGRGRGGKRGRRGRENALAWVMREDVGETCGFGRLAATARGNRVGKLIEGRRAAFLGDSGARNAYGGFVAATSDAWSDVSLTTKDGEKHRDWAHDLVGGAKATFTWAPYASDVVDALDAYSERDAPDLIVISTALWHVLHDESVSRYKTTMAALGARVRTIEAAHPKVVIVWIDAALVIRDKLVAEDKRVKFTDTNLARYAKIRDDQKSTRIVLPAGPAVRVRAREITALCGAECSVDGVHYRPVVYDAVAQIILNIARSRWR